MRAIILAAGRGERMGSLTNTCPKPLLEVGGRSLIEHQIERLRIARFDDLVVNQAYLGGDIRDRLGDGHRLGVRIRYSPEPFGALDTGGGIRNALPLVGRAPFAVVNCDVWSDFDFAQLHEVNPHAAHLILVNNPPQHPDGDFALEHGLARTEGSPRWTFAGISVYHPSFFDGTPSGAFSVVPMLRERMATGDVTAQLHHGLWIDVGTPERLEALRASVV
jgi:N-acetyl-alpha-D-muramate 1-phosphate uridylyltransferase